MLQRPRVSKSVCAFGLILASALALPVQADNWDKKTTITISQAIEVPGAVLQPGQYVLKLVDSQSNRHIVQVTNAEENHVYTTILAMPNERLRPSGKTILSYYETPAGQPPAVRAWFYPGDVIGEEFAYPKNRATEIAKATNLNVPVAPDNMPAAPAPVAATPDGRKSEAALTPRPTPAPPVVEENPGAAPAPSLAQNRPPAPEPTPAPVAAQQSRPAPPQMPHTGSNLPLWGMLGIGCLALAGSLRLLRKYNS